MAEATYLTTATATTYFKEVAELYQRNRQLLYWQKQHGGITYGWAGHECKWNADVGEMEVQNHGVATEYVFTGHDLQIQFTHDWRGHQVTHKQHEKERLMNRGAQAIWEYYKGILPRMKTQLDQTWHKQMYGDGSSDPLVVHGLKTFLKFTTPSSAGDRVAVPQSTTYAGVSISLGSILSGGTWTSDLGTGNYPNSTLAKDWPNGNGTNNYDCTSPLGINDSSTAWDTGSTEFQVNAWTVIEQAVDWQVHRCGEEGRPDMILMAIDKFNAYKRCQEGRLRITVPHQESNDLGFRGTLNQDGVMIATETDVPAGEWYGICFDKWATRCMYDSMWGVKGPEHDIKDDYHYFKAGFWGNCVFQPKFFIFGKSFI